jgi:hypothetical protein
MLKKLYFTYLDIEKYNFVLCSKLETRLWPQN